MEKKKIRGNLIVVMLFVFVIGSLLVFGNRLTGYAVYEDSEGGFENSKEKIGIEVGNSYIPGEEVVFKIVLYDDDTNKIEGVINYKVFNYYSEVVKEGRATSGEQVIYKLDTDAYQGPWEISANYNNVNAPRTLFTVGELEKVDIKIEGDVLIIKNIGNTIYDQKILVYIGQYDQTIDWISGLEIGQTKRIRLTAPDGNYDIRVIEGNEEKVLEFEGISLTGNVVGLERVIGDNFWKKYPLVVLFLGAMFLIIVVVGFLKFRKKTG